MLHNPKPIPPCASFWDEAARILIKTELLGDEHSQDRRDFSAIRVIVPTFLHIQSLRNAMAAAIPHTFIPPRIVTLDAWLALQPPMTSHAESARVVALYGELRQHAWLKKLFSAKRNTDLLPLAQTLISLSDELTQALLPALKLAPDEVGQRWQEALAQLSPATQSIWSDEAQLVWSVWKSQLDAGNRCSVRFAQMMRLAEQAQEPLAWISPVEPSPFEAAFLEAYGEHCPVLPITLDWRSHMLHAAHAAAWPEILQGDGGSQDVPAVSMPPGLSLIEAESLEQEAQFGAQTVIDWLAEGRSCIAVIAQDRVVARRLRALLERARVYVADETGWKLSTTRAASLLAAWFDTVASRAGTAALLDLLKSPYIAAGMEDRDERVMHIEAALRRDNVNGGWEAALSSLERFPAEHGWLMALSSTAQSFMGQRRTIAEWVSLTLDMFDTIDARPALEADTAGLQLLAMLNMMRDACRGLMERISFSEWRAFAALEIESTPFIAPQTDRRVVMLPLNGARLRCFDAVLVVGADVDNLPSRSGETLFFSNAVRGELGLATRESLQRQQLRDLSELMHANGEVVLSWQGIKNGETNPPSPWISRLQLALRRAGASEIPQRAVAIPERNLAAKPTMPPQPSAPELLPGKLSATDYNSLNACPYQFFARRMLGLEGLDELSDLPEKRDYGNWLHEILNAYHESLQSRPLPPEQRLARLKEISDQRFEAELAHGGAALGYYMRWQKAMPAYLAWCDEHEKEGWRYAAGEQRVEKTLSLDGREVTLYGRIDRIDRKASGETDVLDYKAKSFQSLRGKLKEREDHQLAFYGLLFDQPVDHAHYVALEPQNGKTGAVSADDYPQWRSALGEKVVSTLTAISAGQALPATGVNETCEYCDVRGLCRKGMW